MIYKITLREKKQQLCNYFDKVIFEMKNTSRVRFFLFCGNMLHLYYRYLNAPREKNNSLRRQKTSTIRTTT